MTAAIDLSTPEGIDKLLALCDAAMNDAQTILCNVAQVFDGWHQDGTAWSEWDESVRKDVTKLLLWLEKDSAARTALPLVLAELKLARERIRELEAENTLLRSESLREAAHWLELHEKAEQERDDFARRCIHRATYEYFNDDETVETILAAVREELAREKGAQHGRSTMNHGSSDNPQTAEGLTPQREAEIRKVAAEGSAFEEEERSVLVDTLAELDRLRVLTDADAAQALAERDEKLLREHDDRWEAIRKEAVERAKRDFAERVVEYLKRFHRDSDDEEWEACCNLPDKIRALASPERGEGENNAG